MIITEENTTSLQLEKNKEREKSAVTYFPAESEMVKGAIRLQPAGQELQHGKLACVQCHALPVANFK